jgi:hypothetical protein
MMQIKQQNRNTEIEFEKEISQYQCHLGMFALEICRPFKNYKVLREMMETIEETYEESDEYLLMKAEILIEANEWKDVTMLHKRLETRREILPEQWIERMNAIGEEIRQRENMIRKNKLISYSNQISRNLFEKDEDINRATQLMWNRDYEEAINETCKVWTVIMIIEKPEVIFAKIKVLQIMIESILSIVLSDTKDAEGWLEILNKLDNNGIMTSILSIKMMIRKHAEKEDIRNQFIDTIKRIGIIDDARERNDWYSQKEELKLYFKDLNGEIITMDVPQNSIPTPNNMIQTLIGHQDKPRNVEVIREEQDARELHKEIIECIKSARKTQGKEKKEKKSNKEKSSRKGAEKKVNYNDVSSDEIDKFEETEEETKNEKEPPYNLENESKETLRASWKNEMETHVDKNIPRITSRHFKKNKKWLKFTNEKSGSII